MWRWPKNWFDLQDEKIDNFLLRYFNSAKTFPKAVAATQEAEKELQKAQIQRQNLSLPELDAEKSIDENIIANETAIKKLDEDVARRRSELQARREELNKKFVQTLEDLLKLSRDIYKLNDHKAALKEESSLSNNPILYSTRLMHFLSDEKNTAIRQGLFALIEHVENNFIENQKRTSAARKAAKEQAAKVAEEDAQKAALVAEKAKKTASNQTVEQLVNMAKVAKAAAETAKTVAKEVATAPVKTVQAPAVGFREIVKQYKEYKQQTEEEVRKYSDKDERLLSQFLSLVVDLRRNVDEKNNTLPLR